MMTWLAVLGFASAVLCLLIAVGERGEKRELIKSRDRAWRERDEALAETKDERGKRIKAERLLSRVLLSEDNQDMTEQAESIPVSFEERAG